MKTYLLALTLGLISLTARAQEMLPAITVYSPSGPNFGLSVGNSGGSTFGNGTPMYVNGYQMLANSQANSFAILNSTPNLPSYIYNYSYYNPSAPIVGITDFSKDPSYYGPAPGSQVAPAPIAGITNFSKTPSPLVSVVNENPVPSLDSSDPGIRAEVDAQCPGTECSIVTIEEIPIAGFNAKKSDFYSAAAGLKSILALNPSLKALFKAGRLQIGIAGPNTGPNDILAIQRRWFERQMTNRWHLPKPALGYATADQGFPIVALNGTDPNSQITAGTVAHELGHIIMFLIKSGFAGQQAMNNFNSQIGPAYNQALASGAFSNSYASKDIWEYFAEITKVASGQRTEAFYTGEINNINDLSSRNATGYALIQALRGMNFGQFDDSTVQSMIGDSAPLLDTVSINVTGGSSPVERSDSLTVGVAQATSVVAQILTPVIPSMQTASQLGLDLSTYNTQFTAAVKTGDQGAMKRIAGQVNNTPNYVGSRFFNATYYLSKYSDLRAAFGNDTVQAMNHWINYGINEGRQASDSFFTVEYLAKYPDVAQVYGANNYSGAMDHFLSYGMGEGRSGRLNPRAELFNAEYYLSKYSDLRAAFGSDAQRAYNHWVTNGIREGRQASYSFSTVEYLAMYRDVAAVYGANNYQGAIDHYSSYGANEGRAGRFGLRAEVFNVEWYLNHYSDLRAAFGNNTAAADQHWLNNGINEGRQGTAGFFPWSYLNRYSDLVAAFGAGNYAAAIQHFINYGIAEGRTGNP